MVLTLLTKVIQNSSLQILPKNPKRLFLQPSKHVTMVFYQLFVFFDIKRTAASFSNAWSKILQQLLHHCFDSLDPTLSPVPINQILTGLHKVLFFPLCSQKKKVLFFHWNGSIGSSERQSYLTFTWVLHQIKLVLIWVAKFQLTSGIRWFMLLRHEKYEFCICMTICTEWFLNLN